MSVLGGPTHHDHSGRHCRLFPRRANDEIFKKVQYVDPPTTIYYVHTNAFGFVTGITAAPVDPCGYQLADVASSFTMYADGSLAEYRYNNMDTGDYVRLDYAYVTANQRVTFGEDSQYSNGPIRKPPDMMTFFNRPSTS